MKVGGVEHVERALPTRENMRFLKHHLSIPIKHHVERNVASLEASSICSQS